MESLSRLNLLQLTVGLEFVSVIPKPHHFFGSMWSRQFREPKRETSPITTNEEFYIPSYRNPLFVPTGQWALAVRHRVNRPFTRNYRQLLDQPRLSQIVKLECEGNDVVSETMDTAKWERVWFKGLLDRAGVRAQAYDAVFHATDGYSDSQPSTGPR